MKSPVISADSHVAEPEEAYRDIDPAYRDRAPRLVYDEKTGAGLWVDGLPQPIPMAFINAAGRRPEDITKPVRYDELNPAAYEQCWDGVDNDCDGAVDDEDPECWW